MLIDRETEKLSADAKLAERSEQLLAKSVDDLKRANASVLAGGSAGKNFKATVDQQPAPVQTSPVDTLALQPAAATAFFRSSYHLRFGMRV